MTDIGQKLDAAAIEQFIRDGFVRLDHAFPKALAEAGRAVLWRDLPGEPDEPSSWTRPVVRLGWYDEAPFRQAVNMPALHAAFDQLVGIGRWTPRTNLGAFPVRFPHPDDPGDTGWHVDLSFPGPASDPQERQDFSSWRFNVTSRGRALLMLFLFSDIGVADAPTRLRLGSHLDVARALEPAGEAGVSQLDFDRLGAGRQEALATGDAGTVYLCHPFLIHAARRHCGTAPRFLAQPPLPLAQPYLLDRPDGAYSPVERAIRTALGRRADP